MEIADKEYNELLCHVDDLKKVCEKLKLDLNLLEIPIRYATRNHLLKIDLIDIDSSLNSSLDIA